MIEYHPETGDFAWKNGRRGFKKGPYRQVQIDKYPYLTSRLAWFYVHGEWPLQWIDHINGDPSDDRIVNLRPASPFQNKGNTKRSISNSSGLKGVHFDKKKRKWRAMIKIGGKSKSLGYFVIPQMAHKAYLKAAHAAFGQFARGE